MVTKSRSFDVRKEVKERRISFGELMSHVHSTPLRYFLVSIRSFIYTTTPSPLVNVPELCPVDGMQEQTPGLMTPLCFSRHAIATTFSVFTGAGSTQVQAAAAEYLPAAQSAQVEAAVAPTAAENLPAAQSVQTVEASAEYLPAPQGVLGAGAGVEVAGAGVEVAGAGVGVAGAGVGVAGAEVGGK